MNIFLLSIVFIILETFLIFIISKTLINNLARIFLRLTKSHKATVHILAILFLPGTILHELAHLLTAGVLFVPVGEISVIPEIEGDSVKLGSVQIGMTDPIRRMIIGVAPLLVGLGIIMEIIYFNKDSLSSAPWWLLLLFGYLIFQITNTMFSSKKDMEGAVAFFGIFILIISLSLLTLYLSGNIAVLSNVSQLNFSGANFLIENMCKFLLVPLALDLIILGIIKILIRE